MLTLMNEANLSYNLIEYLIVEYDYFFKKKKRRAISDEKIKSIKLTLNNYLTEEEKFEINSLSNEKKKKLIKSSYKTMKISKDFLEEEEENNELSIDEEYLYRRSFSLDDIDVINYKPYFLRREKEKIDENNLKKKFFLKKKKKFLENLFFYISLLLIPLLFLFYVIIPNICLTPQPSFCSMKNNIIEDNFYYYFSFENSCEYCNQTFKNCLIFNHYQNIQFVIPIPDLQNCFNRMSH